MTQSGPAERSLANEHRKSVVHTLHWITASRVPARQNYIQAARHTPELRF